MLNGRLVFSRSPNDSKVFVVRLWNSKSGQVSLLWIMTVNGADSLSYLTQITKLQSHSAVSGLLAFCKIPRPNFNSGRRFCASGEKCKRNMQRYVEFKSLFFPYGWGVLVYFTALLNWTAPSTFTCNTVQKPKNCDQPRELRQTKCWKPGIFLRLHIGSLLTISA